MYAFQIPADHPHRKLSQNQLRELGYEYENDARDAFHKFMKGGPMRSLAVIAAPAKPAAPIVFSAAPAPAPAAPVAPVIERKTLPEVIAAIRAVVVDGTTFYSARDLWSVCGFSAKHAKRGIALRIGEPLTERHVFPGVFEFTPAYALTLAQVHKVAGSLGIEVPAPAPEPTQAPSVNAEALVLLARIEADTAALRALLTRPDLSPTTAP